MYLNTLKAQPAIVK